jgi:threonine dehydratase
MISRIEIQDAWRRIARYVRRTPEMAMEEGAWGIDARILLKLECQQHTGSFKPRGAFNCILSSTVPPAGLIAASGGNHGAAVAYAAQQLGLPAEIFVPTISPAAKVERLRQYGANVTVTGRDYAEALAASKERAAQTGAFPVHAYDDPHVLAGQGTLAMEWELQVRGLETVLIAVGGGGLISGVASWYQDRVRVIGVEPERAPTLYKALEAGKPVDVDVSGVAADSLGASRAGDLVFPIAKAFVDQVVLVSDEQIVAAQKTLWQKLRIAPEPGGATALAALLSVAYKPQPGERVGVVICGANTDLAGFPV